MIGKVRLQDVTLRDGNHALRHSLDASFVRDYCAVADGSAATVVEVGHGMGIGASSHLVGRSKETDSALLTAAREALSTTSLGVHSIPGFSSIQENIVPAMEIGVDVFRVATHVTEADTSAPHLEFVVNAGREAVGVLMMSHMAPVPELIAQALVMQSAGASSLMIMDSAGHYVPRTVRERISALVDALQIPVGFHAHNNFNSAIANSLAAIESGATTIDAATMGLGAGAGNAQLECLIAVLQSEYGTPIDLDPFLELSKMIEGYASSRLPHTTATSVVSGKSGVVSAFAPYVSDIAEDLGVSAIEIWKELGRRRIIAGQESIIREVALQLVSASE